VFGYDALFAHLYYDWPGPEVAMASWPKWKWDRRRELADEIARRDNLPVPVISRY
jgi:hypothetical protein